MALLKSASAPSGSPWVHFTSPRLLNGWPPYQVEIDGLVVVAARLSDRLWLVFFHEAAITISLNQIRFESIALSKSASAPLEYPGAL